jgi:hypothetical protein
MRGHRLYETAGPAALVACALIAAGCGGGGDDSTTTTTSVAASPQQTVDSAVNSCTKEAQQLGGAAGTSLDNACTYLGTGASQALSGENANVKQVLSNAVSRCRKAVGQLPSEGTAQAALSKLCDAIASAQ